MAIRTVKPTSPSLRYLTYVTYDDITKTEPEKGLLIPKRRTNGRNVYGRITVRHRGGGAKQMIRQVVTRSHAAEHSADPIGGFLFTAMEMATAPPREMTLWVIRDRCGRSHRCSVPHAGRSSA